MSGTLRIKRRPVGGAAGAPASLAAAEIAYNEQDDILYYGKGDSAGLATSIIAIGGPGAFSGAPINSPVFTGDPRAPTPAATDNDTSIATTAYVRSVVRSTYGVRGLVGSAGITATTQIALSFTEAVLHDSAGVGVLIKAGSFTLASGTVGANGCDVALADGDVSVYAIWGSTPGNAGICSNAGPTTGPALPSGYTHWAYLTTVKRSGGVFYAVAIRGNKVFYQTAPTVALNVNASSWTSYSTAAYVPAIALNIFLNCYGAATTTGSGGLAYQVGWNNTVSYIVRLDTGYATPNGVSVPLQCTLPNVGQVVWHQWQTLYNIGNFATNGFYIYLVGFEVPNDA